MDIYQHNYFNLLQLSLRLHDMTERVTLTAIGQTDVHVDMIERHPYRVVIRVSHYLQRPHGPAIPDPDMTIEVCLLAETAAVLTYCDCFGSRKVFSPELMAFSPPAQAELNHFLDQWLTKMIADGRRALNAEPAQ